MNNITYADVLCISVGDRPADTQYNYYLIQLMSEIINVT